MEPSSLLCPSCELCPVSSRLALVLFHFRFPDPLKKITSVLTLSSVSEVSSRILAFSHSLRNRCNCDFASRATVSRISYRIHLFDGKNEKMERRWKEKSYRNLRGRMVVGKTNYRSGMSVLESVMKFDLAIGTTR